MLTEQLPLNVAVRTHLRLENYSPGVNQQIVSWLKKFADEGQQDKLVLVWGQRGVGKTHLLSALCNYHTDLGFASFYLSLDHYAELQPSVLENVENTGFVVIDNIHAMAGNAAWETAVFDLYNRVLDGGGQLLMSSNCAPQQLSFCLPDLSSRMMQCLALKLEDLTDVQKHEILTIRGEEKGLNVNADVYYFLLRHYRRDLSSLMQALETLDEASLIKKRRITIPFIKEVLAIELV